MSDGTSEYRDGKSGVRPINPSPGYNSSERERGEKAAAAEAAQSANRSPFAHNPNGPDAEPLFGHHQPQFNGEADEFSRLVFLGLLWIGGFSLLILFWKAVLIALAVAGIVYGCLHRRSVGWTLERLSFAVLVPVSYAYRLIIGIKRRLLG
ncbi:MAG: hypothetical protein IV094_11890 [Vitreoscilla sp.]|nr:hypothetical protein [Vitreoscilla sp.]